MTVALLMLLGPLVVYLLTLPLTGHLERRLRRFYRYVAGFWVVAGSAASCYLAAYTGDQGGIAAFFMQLAVVVGYLVLGVSVLLLHLLQTPGGQGGRR